MANSLVEQIYNKSVPSNRKERRAVASITKKKKKTDAKKAASTSTIFPIPNIIPVDSPDYRVVPGVTPHPYVSGVLMDELFWELPDFPVERNYLKGLSENNKRQLLGRVWQSHLAVVITTRIPNATELAAGKTEIKTWLEDGHHRRENWRRQIEDGDAASVPSAIVVIENVIDNDTELYDTYYQYDSADSVEEIHQKVDAMINEMSPIDPTTGETWVRKTSFMKNGSLVTIMNRLSSHTGPAGDRISTWKAGPDSATGRSKSAVSNDIAKDLLSRYMDSLIALDEFLSNRMEGNYGLKSMTKSGKVKNVKGCAGKSLYDTATKVALMAIWRACGGKWHPNIVKAFEEYVDNWKFVGANNDVETANMEYNMNRFLRDATPHPAKKMSEPVSKHLRLKCRDERAKFMFGFADTMYNLVSIVIHGPEAKEGPQEDWHSDKTETYAWFQNFIMESEKMPLS